MGRRAISVAGDRPARRDGASWWESAVVIWLLRVLSIVVIALVVSTAHARIDRQEVAVPTYAIASGHPSAAYPPIPRRCVNASRTSHPGFRWRPPSRSPCGKG